MSPSIFHICFVTVFATLSTPSLSAIIGRGYDDYYEAKADMTCEIVGGSGFEVGDHVELDCTEAGSTASDPNIYGKITKKDAAKKTADFEILTKGDASLIEMEDQAAVKCKCFGICTGLVLLGGGLLLSSVAGAAVAIAIQVGTTLAITVAKGVLKNIASLAASAGWQFIVTKITT